MRALAEFQAALMLMSRLPAGRVADPFPAIRDTVWAYPLAGLVIGGLGAMVLAAAQGLGLPAGIAVTLALVVTAIATGAFHEDGLADCADSLGGRGRDRRLSILKDSRIGSFGTVALILSYGLRIQGYAALGAAAPMAMLALAMASRAPIAAILYALPPARAEGMGHAAARPALARVGVSLGLGAGAALWIGGPLVLAAVALAATLTAWAARRLYGGQLGDALGASQQLAEIAALLLLLPVSV